jgi:hypothetical protein
MLPVELLEHIFVLLSLGVPDNGSLPCPSWLPIAHVCHYWRTVALSHAQLWASITPGLSLPWIKAFMERSRAMLMDFSFLVHPQLETSSDTRPRILHNDIILLLEGFTRVRSLCLTGTTSVISPIMNSLSHPLPVQILSLCIEDGGWKLILPDDLFGGKAPIRRLQFIPSYGCHISAPAWLFRSVTHFTSTEAISYSPSELKNLLRQMSALTHVEIQSYTWWRNLMVNPGTSPIPMPQLMNLVVRAHSPNVFIRLNQLLLLHIDAKRRLELIVSDDHEHRSPFLCFVNTYQIGCLSQIAEAANGFRHIQISGTQTEGWCRLWTGTTLTTWEDAKFGLSFKWIGFQEDSMDRFITMCCTLGVARVRRLVIDSPPPSLPTSYWWKLLGILPGIEELELYPVSLHTLGAAWKVKLAPAVLPTLRRVQILDPKLASPRQYTIIGDPPSRKIVRPPGTTKDNRATSSEMVFAEKELKNLSKGLLKLLRGLGRNLHSG